MVFGGYLDVSVSLHMTHGIFHFVPVSALVAMYYGDRKCPT